MGNRRDAYEQTYNTQTELVIEDSKGTWKASYLKRATFEADGDHQYYLYISFQANLVRLPKASHWLENGYVFMRHNEGIETLKRRIADKLEYTPTPATVRQFFERFLLLRDTYTEEDRYYQAGDKAAAAEVLQRYYEIAIDRFLSGSNLAPEGRRELLTMDKYLTREEIRDAEEAQKVINGHSHVEPMSIYSRTGHLAAFNARLSDDVDQLRRKQELESKKKHRQSLRDMLETDVEFRRLVAHAIQANEEIRAGSVDHELGHRLFGYTQSLDEYRNSYYQLDELLKQYGLRTFDVGDLVRIGKEYLQAGGMLPIVTAPHCRVPGKFYYDDHVHNGTVFFKVNKVGNLYVYGDGSKRYEKRTVRHFDRIQPIPDPDSVQDFLYNELVRIHNVKRIPDAHRKPLQDVFAVLAGDRNASQIANNYEKKIEEATAAHQKVVFQILHSGIRRQLLKVSIKGTEGLKTLGAYKTLYENSVRALADVERFLAEQSIEIKAG